MILLRASLQPAADTPRTPSIRSLVIFTPGLGPRKHPIAVVPRWVSLPAAVPSRAKRCRTVEFKPREF